MKLVITKNDNTNNNNNRYSNTLGVGRVGVTKLARAATII